MRDADGEPMSRTPGLRRSPSSPADTRLPSPAAFPGGARQGPGFLGLLWRLELQHQALWGGPRAGARCALAVGNPPECGWKRGGAASRQDAGCLAEPGLDFERPPHGSPLAASSASSAPFWPLPSSPLSPPPHLLGGEGARVRVPAQAAGGTVQFLRRHVMEVLDFHRNESVPPSSLQILCIIFARDGSLNSTARGQPRGRHARLARIDRVQHVG